MATATIEHPLQVKALIGGNYYWLPALEIHRRYVLTKYGRIKYSSVEGYRFPWTGTLQPNLHFILEKARGGFFG